MVRQKCLMNVPLTICLLFACIAFCSDTSTSQPAFSCERWHRLVRLSLHHFCGIFLWWKLSISFIWSKPAFQITTWGLVAKDRDPQGKIPGPHGCLPNVPHLAPGLGTFTGLESGFIVSLSRLRTAPVITIEFAFLPRSIILQSFPAIHYRRSNGNERLSILVVVSF